MAVEKIDPGFGCVPTTGIRGEREMEGKQEFSMKQIEKGIAAEFDDKGNLHLYHSGMSEIELAQLVYELFCAMDRMGIISLIKSMVDGNVSVNMVEHGTTDGTKKRCRRCGSEVIFETDEDLKREYEYYCPTCDENMYSFECEDDPD